MSEKITEIDLARKLGARAHVSESVASDFIATYFSLILDGLETDGIVKITGLGTFKLVLSESRKIVNVQTKEDQEIPSHYRITFTPDKELAVRLNEPFAHLTTINLDDEGLREEPIDPIANAAREYFDEKIHEIPLLIDAPVLNKEIDSYVSDSDLVDKLAIKEVQTDQLDQRECKPLNEAMISHVQERSAIRVILVSCLLTLVLFAVIYFFFISSPDEYTAYYTQPELSIADDSIISTRRDSVPLKLAVSDLAIQELAPHSKEYKPVAEEIIHYGSRLTLLAQKYYGNKHFWCYIYEENKDHINNPNLIPVGTKIKIPDPEKYKIDARSASSVESAVQKAKEINNRY